MGTIVYTDMDIFTSLFTSRSTFGKEDGSKSPKEPQKKDSVLHETTMTEMDLPYESVSSPKKKKDTKKK